MDFIIEAFEMIKDNLLEEEKRGHYIFNITQCRDESCSYQEDENRFHSPHRQKPIDLYDLMDVELRMIRQKNMEMDLAQKEGQSAYIQVPDEVQIE